MVNAYDAEIRRTDDLVGDLLADLESLGVNHRTWVTLVSDHGEGFGEHRLREHGNSFFDELLRVPLVLLPPRGRREPRRVSDPVSTVDLFPTILEMGGLAAPDELPGRSLLRFLDATGAEPRFLFSESPHSGDIEGAAVRSGPWKFIAYESGESLSHLFHLGNDPAEENDLTEKERKQRARLRDELERHLITVDRNRVALGAVEAGEADEETLERLRALGYVD
jgi:arylsulfatase A-like enzyme